MQELNTIKEFISKSQGLKITHDQASGNISVEQKCDKKTIHFNAKDLEEVLEREGADKETFLQVNFFNRKKILLTSKYIGFSPAPCGNLDPSKLPKVVTTPDLFNVIEAIESFLYGEERYEEDFEDVKLFFESISCGAESIGFNLVGERLWVEKLITNHL